MTSGPSPFCSAVWLPEEDTEFRQYGEISNDFPWDAGLPPPGSYLTNPEAVARVSRNCPTSGDTSLTVTTDSFFGMPSGCHINT